jgi:hypothetical protein
MKTLTLATLTAAALLSASYPALSMEERMTDASIRKYYDDLPGVFKKPYDEFIKDYSARATDSLVINSATTLKLPGQPPTQSTSILTKDQLISGAGDAYAAAKNARLWNQVTKVTISSDGKSATVEEVSRISGISMPSEDPDHPFQADSTEICTDELVLTSGIGIQTSKSDCTVTVTITRKL